MLDSPPPSTITSGSSMLMTTASPRASRSAWRASALRARFARRRAGRNVAGIMRARAVAVARQRRAGDVGLQAAPIAAPAMAAGDFVSRGQGSGLCPHSPAIGAGRDARCRPPRCRRRTGAQDNAEHQPIAGASAIHRLGKAKQLASFSTRTSRSSFALISRSKVAVQRDRVGVLHPPGCRTDHARDADADRCGLPELRFSVSRTRPAMPSSVLHSRAGWDRWRTSRCRRGRGR